MQLGNIPNTKAMNKQQKIILTQLEQLLANATNEKRRESIRKQIADFKMSCQPKPKHSHALLGSSDFVFLDNSRWPYLLREKDNGEWWMYYWQSATKSWTPVRPADEEEVNSLRDRALPPDQAALYLPNNQTPSTSTQNK